MVTILEQVSELEETSEPPSDMTPDVFERISDDAKLAGGSAFLITDTSVSREFVIDIEGSPIFGASLGLPSGAIVSTEQGKPFIVVILPQTAPVLDDEGIDIVGPVVEFSITTTEGETVELLELVGICVPYDSLVVVDEDVLIMWLVNGVAISLEDQTQSTLDSTVCGNTMNLGVFLSAIENATVPSPKPAVSIELSSDWNVLPANGKNHATLSVLVKDDLGQPVVDGTLVSFELFPATSGFLGETAVQTINGTAEVTYVADISTQSIAITASADSVTDSQAVTLFPSDDSYNGVMVLAVTPLYVLASSAAVVMVDGFTFEEGIAYDGLSAVTFSIDGVPSSRFEQQFSYTGVSGDFGVKYSSDPVVGAYTITARLGLAVSSAVLNVVTSLP